MVCLHCPHAAAASIVSLMNGEKHRFFKDEISRKLTHAKAGTVAMANAGTANTNGSQFYITLRDGLEDQLDGKNTVFGEVVDGLEVLDVISNAYCDDGGRPYIDIRYVPVVVVFHPPLAPSQERMWAGSSTRSSSTTRRTTSLALTRCVLTSRQSSCDQLQRLVVVVCDCRGGDVA